MMKFKKPIGPALFMYTVIAISIIIWVVCFFAYYGGTTNNSAVLWTGIVSFMIMYHLWLRIIMGNVTKLFKINPQNWWFREKSFEKKLYRILRVKRWKGKALTYNPESFSLREHTLEEIALVTVKSETDHWINEIISVLPIFFSLIWGQFWIFLVTSLAAMIFDAQFIVIQRYNRPRLLKLAKRKQRG